MKNKLYKFETKERKEMKIQKKIQLSNKQIEVASILAKKFNLHPRIMEILVGRGLDEEVMIEDFLFSKESDFSSPFEIPGMKEAKERIEIAIAGKQKILLVCDYDCDGLCGNGIFNIFFANHDCEVLSYIPEREEGYGLNFDNIKSTLETFSPNLLITCDLGITAVKETKLIKDMGIDVIITDHHTPMEEIPETIVVNPKLKKGMTEFCGAGVVFKLMQALGEGYEKYIELAGIATIGDSVPLMKENRLIVKVGLLKMNTSPNTIVKKLKEMGKISKVDQFSVAFGIVPRLNAGGRMGKAHIVKDLMRTPLENENEIEKYCEELSFLNSERQKQTKESCEVARNICIKNSSKKILVVFDKSFQVGIMGIIASKITEEFHRPTIVLTLFDKVLKGSARSVDGVDLFFQLSKFKHLFESFGGHVMACGLSIKEENFPIFKKAIEAEFDILDSDIFDEKCFYDQKTNSKEIDKDLILSLEALEPFGEGNPLPIFLMEEENMKFSPLGSTGDHLVSNVSGVKVVGFGIGKQQDRLNSQKKNKFLVTLQMDRYNGAEKPSAMIKKILKTKIDFTFEETLILEKAEFSVVERDYIYKKLLKSPFSTLILCEGKKMFEEIENDEIFKNLNVEKSFLKDKGNNNTVLVNCKSTERFEEYENIFTLSNSKFGNLETFQPKTIGLILKSNNLSKKIDREMFVLYYKRLRSLENKKYIRVMDIYYDMCQVENENLDKDIAMFVIDVMSELDILQIKNQILTFSSIKTNLEKSEIYRENQKG